MKRSVAAAGHWASKEGHRECLSGQGGSQTQHTDGSAQGLSWSRACCDSNAGPDEGHLEEGV